MILIELVGGPKDGTRLPFDEVHQQIVLPGRRHTSALSNEPTPAMTEHVYSLILDHGHPSRTDDGAYRYTHWYDR